MIQPQSSPTPDRHPPIDALIVDALHSVRAHLGFEVAFVSELKAGHRIFRYVDSDVDFAPLVAGGSAPADQSYCQRVVDGRLPQLMTDAGEHPEAQRLEATHALPVGAHISVPIWLGDEVFGTFCCFSRAPNPGLDQRDLDVMRLYADFVGRILQRTLQDDRHAEQRYARVREVLDGQLYDMVYQPSSMWAKTVWWATRHSPASGPNPTVRPTSGLPKRPKRACRTNWSSR